MRKRALHRYAGCVLAVMSVLWSNAAPARAAQLNRLSDIRHWSSPTYTRIVLDLGQEAAFESFTLANPARIVVDVLAVAPQVPRDLLVINDNIVRQVRASGSGSDRVRIVIDLEQQAEHTIFSLGPIDSKPPRLVIDISRPDLEAADQARRTQVRTSIQPGTRIVVVDPGHGGEDPGAVRGKLYEKNIVLAVSRRLVDSLNRQPGITAYLTRTGDYFIPLAKRIEIARQYGADLFISIHADASFNKKAAGSSVYCLSFQGATSNAARMAAKKENASDFIGGVPLGRLGDDLNNIIFDLLQTRSLNAGLQLAGLVLKEIGFVNQLHTKHPQQANFAVLRAPHIPSVLVETDFISNPQRSQRLADTAFQESLARHITQAVEAFFRQDAPPVQLPVQQFHTQHQPSSQSPAATRPSFHVVERGDTLSGLAARYGTTVAELRRLNNMSPTAPLHKGRKVKLSGGASPQMSVESVPSPVLSDRPSYYVVQAGDTLSGLAARYGTTVAELRRLNTMSPTAALHKGRKLKLPGGAASQKPAAAVPSPALSQRPAYHLVQRGDTLSGLTARYGLSVAELRRLNGMSKSAVLKAGTKLKLM